MAYPVSRDGVMVNMLDSFSGSPGSSPGPAIEDANSNSYIITLVLLSCVLLFYIKEDRYALLECILRGL